MFDVFVIVFGLDRCTTTIDVELLFEQLTIGSAAIKLFRVMPCDLKTKDVHGQVQLNINSRSFVIAIEVCKVS